MTPINVALSVYAEVPPYSVEAVQTRYFPDSVDARKLLKERKASLKDFFALESKAAACILFSEVPVAHWRNIDNNNRATERYIGRLKNVQNKILDSTSHPTKTDIRIRAFLCNMD